MIYKDFDQIGLEDIEKHYLSLEREMKTTEFKRLLIINNNEDKKEFLADITSFANASGGDIFFGIDEKNGVEGFEIENLDALVSKIEHLIRDGVAPRIAYRITQFPVSDSKYVLFIRVEKSFFSPHQVIAFGSDKFWVRGENGKFKLDVYQLKQAFIANERMRDEINDFVIDRVAKIISDEGPVDLQKKPKIILHLIPLKYFSRKDAIELNSYINNKHLGTFNASSFNCGKRFNFDGVVSHHPSSNKDCESYLQLFRTSVLESVSASIIDVYRESDNALELPSSYFLESMVKTLYNHFELLKELNVELPVLLFLNINGIKGCHLRTDRGRVGNAIRENHLRFEEIMIHQFDSSVKILKPWLDHLWQAFGLDKCHAYDNQGRLHLSDGIHV